MLELSLSTTLEQETCSKIYDWYDELALEEKRYPISESVRVDLTGLGLNNDLPIGYFIILVELVYQKDNIPKGFGGVVIQASFLKDWDWSLDLLHQVKTLFSKHDSDLYLDLDKKDILWLRNTQGNQFYHIPSDVSYHIQSVWEDLYEDIGAPCPEDLDLD